MINSHMLRVWGWEPHLTCKASHLPPTDSSSGLTVIIHVGWQLQVWPHTSSILLPVRNRPAVFKTPTNPLFIRRRSDNDVTLSERMKWGQNEANRLCKKGVVQRLGRGGLVLREAAALRTVYWMPSVAKQQQLSGTRLHFFCNSPFL